MKTAYIDPLIPLNETSWETLTRLSANIGTLTELINKAEGAGHSALTAMFNQARDAKVEQAEKIIAQVTAASAQLAEDRRFLLVHDSASAGTRNLPTLFRKTLCANPPGPDAMGGEPPSEAEGKPSADAKLAARRAAIELEMKAAPCHRVGTSWWDEHVEEMRLINRRLRK